MLPRKSFRDEDFEVKEFVDFNRNRIRKSARSIDLAVTRKTPSLFGTQGMSLWRCARTMAIYLP